MGGSLQVGWPTGAAVVVVRQRQAFPFAECPCCDPLRSLEMGSELELVTATCSDGYHLAWVETVMGQTPILHSREYCHFTLRKSGSTKEEFVTLPFSSKIQETHTLPSRAEG